MKIFFDARYIRTDYHDGVSRYSAELGCALGKLAQITYLIHDKKQIPYLPENSHFLIIHAPTSAREPLTARFLNKHNPDVVISPMQTIGSAGRKYKLVLTLHDLIYYRHRTPPTNLSWPIRLGWRLYHLSYVPQRVTLNAADLIMTVSETSKIDIETAKLTKKPIIVIPNAPRDLHEFYPKDVRQKKTAPKNLLFMGVPRTYKGVETLIAGMEWLPDRRLHILSPISDARKKTLQALIPKGADVLFHGGVSDEEYAALLANDAILVTATRDEGYGLPVAEALKFGTPAVVSDLPILREVAGSGALYFPVGDARAFADQVKKLDDKATREKLVRNGQDYIDKFSWEGSARHLLDAVTTLHKTK